MAQVPAARGYTGGFACDLIVKVGLQLWFWLPIFLWTVCLLLVSAGNCLFVFIEVQIGDFWAVCDLAQMLHVAELFDNIDWIGPVW